MSESAWRLYRSAGTLLFVPTGMSELATQDILDSVLLAQLAASKKNDPFDAPQLWRKTWSLTMGQLHWAIAASISREEEHSRPFTLASLFAGPSKAASQLGLDTVLASMRNNQVKGFENLCVRRHADSTQVTFNVAVVLNAEIFRLHTATFRVLTSLDEHWPSQLWPATSAHPANVAYVSNTLNLVSNYALSRPKVIGALGDLRFQETEQIHLTPAP